MPATPTYAFPYPAPADPADVPADMGELATRMEVVLGQFLKAALIDAKGDLLVGTANDVIARLPIGPTNGHVLTVDSAQAAGIKWAAAASGGGSGATLVTALPGSPTDGQEVILVDSLTAPTYSWHLRYVAAKASNRWLFVGGTVLSVEAPAQQSLGAVTVYTDPPTTPLAITLPVAGLYRADYASAMTSDTNSRVIYVSIKRGAATATDADSINPSGLTLAQVGNQGKRSATFQAAAADVWKLQGRAGAASVAVNMSAAVLQIIPVAVGG